MPRKDKHDIGAALERIKALLEREQPSDYQSVRKRLRKAVELFHDAVAQRFEPALNDYAATLAFPQDDLAAKQALARHVSAEMRALGVGLRTADGKIATLRAMPNNNQPSGRFVIEEIGEERRKVKTSSSLPRLELVGRPAFLAERDAAPWAERVGPKAKKPDRKSMIER